MKKNLYDTPKARTDNIVVSELKDELLLYCLETHKAFCLNETAAAVYKTSDGTKSTTEIAEAISKELRSKVTEDFVLFTLDELKAQKLVEFPVSSGIKPNLTSRREAIRRIGLSTAVALPIITMLVAPKAAEAQSTTCGDFLDACTGGGAGPVFAQGTCCANFNCCPNNQCYPTGSCPV